MLTYRGICLNLYESDFKVTIEGITFYFSSKFYLEKFKNNVNDFINNETAKLFLKYKIDINLNLYFMIVYYMRIEKRGFRIIDEIRKKEITKNAVFINQLICY